jgi:predicted nucleic acid-binding protein
VSALVVDASAALALLRNEPGAEAARSHLREQARRGEPMLVPALFWLELVNVLTHRYRLPPPAIVEAVYELEHLGLTTSELGRPGTLAVTDAVGRSGLTAYDAAYLVVAESSDADLLTADTALAAAAGDRAILVGKPDGMAEERAAYHPDPPWTAWSGAAAYLADLRRSLAGATDG